MNNSSEFNILLYQNQMHAQGTWLPHQYGTGYSLHPPNRFVYVKQNFVQPLPQPDLLNKKVLINPNFNKKVFVNPNFQANGAQLSTAPKIHINPNSQNIKFEKQMSNFNNGDKIKKIHVNPNILRTIPVPVENKKNPIIQSTSGTNKIVYSSRTKLIRKPEKTPSSSNTPKTRRKSICSKYKIIKSDLLKKKVTSDIKNKTKLISPIKYKLVKLKSLPMKKNSKYKLDNRPSKIDLKKISAQNKRNHKSYLMKYKTNNLLKIDNILYQKTLHTLRRTSVTKKVKNINTVKTPPKTITKSKYKFIRRKSVGKNSTPTTPILKRINSKTKLRIVKVKKTVSPGKLRKCNIPCNIYRKFGRCRAYENGKCFRKHDSDQIALCTKFLQGACINEKCLLSHNVSPEKMPTCKYYLEGTCSKDQCPYLHVRISPKADICKDFLEGFCKKAKECDKRHQFLCPDYEKHGKCLKQRCSYPHGRMVRKYSVFHSDKFAKKSSEKEHVATNYVISAPKILIGEEEIAKCDGDDKVIAKIRYYAESKLTPQSLNISTGEYIVENQCNQGFDLTTRPKLGSLPSYIAFQDS